MHLPDLTRISAAGSVYGVDVIAVGWLERDVDYTKGDVESAVFEKLAELSKEPWNPVAVAGFHRCSLCRFSQGPAGTQQVFVPSASGLYVCPELITHYMVAHEYAPPPAFRQAVLACPPMRSMPYLRELRRCGVSLAPVGSSATR